MKEVVNLALASNQNNKNNCNNRIVRYLTEIYNKQIIIYYKITMTKIIIRCLEGLFYLNPTIILFILLL